MDFKAKKKIKIEVTSDRDHKTSVLNTDQSINIVYFSTSPLHFNVCGYIIFPFLFLFYKGTVSVGCKGSNKKK